MHLEKIKKQIYKKFHTLNMIFKLIVEDYNKSNIQNLYYFFPNKENKKIRRKVQNLINAGLIELKKHEAVIKNKVPAWNIVSTNIDDYGARLYVTDKGVNYYFNLISRFNRITTFILSTIFSALISSAIALVFVA